MEENLKQLLFLYFWEFVRAASKLTPHSKRNEKKVTYGLLWCDTMGWKWDGMLFVVNKYRVSTYKNIFFFFFGFWFFLEQWISVWIHETISGCGWRGVWMKSNLMLFYRFSWFFFLSAIQPKNVHSKPFLICKYYLMTMPISY